MIFLSQEPDLLYCLYLQEVKYSPPGRGGMVLLCKTTPQCSKEFKIGKDTLSKYILNGLPYKGKIYSRVKLHY